MAPRVSSHSQGFCSLPTPPASVPPPCACHAPWRPPGPALSAVAEGTFQPSLPPDRASACSPLSPLSCMFHGDTVSVACTHPPSSDSASEASPLSPLHPSLLASPSSPLFPTSPGALRPLAPPLALLPPAPAADIAHKDEDVGDRTGRVVAHGSLAGGSAPRRKIPCRPHLVVGDGISRPLLQHLPQQ